MVENLDEEEASLMRRLDEVRKKKEELKYREIVVTVKSFDKKDGKLKIHLSDFRDDIVNVLRTIPDRFFSEVERTNLIGEKHLERFEIQSKALKNIKFEISDEIRKEIEDYRKRPDYVFSLDPRKIKVQVTPSNKVLFKKYVNGIDTWTYNIPENKYYFSTSELFKLPDILRDYFDSQKQTYKLEDDVKFILAGQLLRRKEIEEISMLEDAPEIKSPFNQIDPKTNLPFDLTPDQRVAIKFDKAVGGKSIIAYDVGKGKTAIAIAIAERENLRILFVCKANLKTNIKREIKKFTGKEATVFSGIEPDGLSIEYLFSKKQQYNIIGYEVIGRNGKSKKDGEEDKVMPWVEVINLSGFDRIFYDEAHYLKNIDSKRSKAARHINIEQVDFFSGTPIVNRPKELYPMLNIIDKTTFNQEAEFINNFSDGANGVRNLPALQNILKMYMIRRKNTGIEVKNIPYIVELSPMARALYNKALEGLYICLRKGKQSNITNILTEILRLKQIVAEDTVDSTADLCEEMLDQTEKKVVIFSQFKDVHSLLRRRLGNKASVINGDISSDDARYEIIDKFQNRDSDLKVIITNIMEGLTLTEGGTVIFNDLWWTPKDHIQGSGRCFGRINDNHGGNAYFVAAENTVCQMIQELLTQKMNTIEAVVDDIHKEVIMNTSLIGDLINQLTLGGL